MSNQIKLIVKEIQFKTDLTLDQIAEKLEYSGAYFRNEVSKGTSKPILEKLKAKFNDIIEQNVSQTTKEPETIHKAGNKPSLPEDVSTLIKLLAEKGELNKDLNALKTSLQEIQVNQKVMKAHLSATLWGLASLKANQEKKKLLEVVHELNKVVAESFEKGSQMDIPLKKDTPGR